MSGQGQMELEVGEGGEGQGTKEERDGKGKKGGHTMTNSLTPNIGNCLLCEGAHQNDVLFYAH